MNPRSVGVLAALSLALLSACSGPSHPTPKGEGGGQAQASTQPAPDPVATLARATEVTRSLHSYAFHASYLVGSTQTTIDGSVISPDRSRYTTISGSTQVEVVRIAVASYQRTNAAPWKRVPTSASARSPAVELANVLGGITGVRLAGQVGEIISLEGLLAPENVKELLGGGAAPSSGVPARLEIDSAGHVRKMSLTLPVSVRGKDATLEASTEFTGFDVQPEITAPI